MNNKINIFETSQELVKNFADNLYEIIANSKDKITISLSGGSTPKILFEYISKNYASKIDWTKVHFFWGDERCVPPDNDDSNYLMTKLFLFDNIDIPNKNIHRIWGENNPKEEVGRYSKEIQKFVKSVNGVPQFDIVILGMGEDGHTASIFPEQIDFMYSDNICELATHPLTGQNRITITTKVINNAKNIFFLITGTKKASVLFEIINKKGNYKKYPASYIENAVWFIDKEAAQEL